MERPYNPEVATRVRHAASVAPRLSVIVLVYNEVESVAPLHEELMGVLEALDMPYEVLYIDDGSRDGSTERLGQFASRDAHVRVVSFRRNFGQTAAVQAGIDNSHGEVLVFMDGDMQNDPHDIPRLLEKIDEGNDVVSGWRKERQDDAVRIWPSKIANWIIARVTGVPLHDFGCTLKAYQREVIQEVKLYGEMHRFIPVYASWVGARITEIAVNHRPREFGTSKYSLARTSRVLLDLITVKLLGSYSTKPIYFFGFAAFGLWAAALSVPRSSSSRSCCRPTRSHTTTRCSSCRSFLLSSASSSSLWDCWPSSRSGLTTSRRPKRSTSCGRSLSDLHAATPRPTGD